MTWILARLIALGVPERFARIVALVLGVLLVVGAVLLVLSLKSCFTPSAADTQAKVNAGQLSAFQNSASDATNTVGAVNANQTATEDQTRRNTEEITHAEGASNVVAPAVNDAFLRAACQRASARHDPKCRLLQPHP